MSRYSDINQLLEEIGTSDRSAGDPWTISRGSPRTVKSSSFSPSVTADLGASPLALTSELQSAEQIAKADAVVTSPAEASGGGTSKSSTGSGLLSGLLNLFPLGSALGKLFGLGDSASPPPPTPYIQPPSINFEGAMESSLSSSTVHTLPGAPSRTGAGQADASVAFATGVSSLSYGATGMPRAVGESQPANPINDFHDETGADVSRQLGSLTRANFIPEPATNSPMASADLAATTHVQTPAPSSLGASTSSTVVPETNSSSGGSNSQSGQSILVQVQAMDSQSFMDHSNDIAQAVRQAMLNMHSVNDVIADL